MRRARRRCRALDGLARRIDISLGQIDLLGETTHLLRDLRVERSLHPDLLVVGCLLLVHLGEEGLEQLGDVVVALIHGGQHLSRGRRSFQGRRHLALERLNPAMNFGCACRISSHRRDGCYRSTTCAEGKNWRRNWL